MRWLVAAMLPPAVLLVLFLGPTLREQERGNSTDAVSGRPGKGPSVLRLTPALDAKLRALAGGLRREIVLCLQGEVRGDTALATDFHMPEPELSTSTRSTFRECPRGTLGTWHNHPGAVGGTTGRFARDGSDLEGDGGSRRKVADRGARSEGSEADRSGLASPRSRPFLRGTAAGSAALCVLSRLDVETTARLGYPFAVVGVDERTWCWWRLDQVRSAPGAELPAPPGQLSGGSAR